MSVVKLPCSCVALRDAIAVAFGLLACSAGATNWPDIVLFERDNNSRTLNIGDQVTLTSQPQGRAYQWYHDGLPLAGGNGPSLLLASLTLADAGNYECRVVNDAGAVLRTALLPLSVTPVLPTAIDPSFTYAKPADVLSARPVATVPDGGLIIRETLAGPQQRYARLAADGQRNSSYSLPESAGEPLVVLRNGTQLTGKAPFLLSLDGSPLAFSLPSGFDPAQPLSAAAVQSDGRILIAQGASIARLYEDGRSDPELAPVLPAGMEILCVAVDPLSRILVGGAPSNGHPGLVRLSERGLIDPGFSPPALSPNVWPAPSAFRPANVFPTATGGYIVVERNLTTCRLLDDGGLASPDPLVVQQRMPIRFGISAVVADNSGRVFVALSGLFEGPSVRRIDRDRGNSFNAGISGSINSLFVGSGNQIYADMVRLRGDASVAFPPNVYATDSGPCVQGGTARLTCWATGNGPFAFHWRALDGQPVPTGLTSESPDSTSSVCTIASFGPEHVGRYQASVTGPGGTVLSDILTLALDENPVHLANLSGRAVAGTGEDTVVAGVVTESRSGHAVPLLIRGVGPALVSAGVTNVLPNPVIELYERSGTRIARNDDWGDDARLANAFVLTGASPLPTGGQDAALLSAFTPGVMTAMLKSAAPEQTGVGLLEIYRADAGDGQFDATNNLVNLSFRARTGSGENTAAAGFVVVDRSGLQRRLHLLLRAIGPTLSTQGITHPLANPVLTLFDRTGTPIATNDDWAVNNTSAEPTALAATTKQVGAFSLPTDSKDAALLMDLSPGVYTMHATGGEGVVLLEIYLVP